MLEKHSALRGSYYLLLSGSFDLLAFCECCYSSC
nr:MAG TPA: hypothetical protein [Caudoviricetes sp.]